MSNTETVAEANAPHIIHHVISFIQTSFVVDTFQFFLVGYHNVVRLVHWYDCKLTLTCHHLSTLHTRSITYVVTSRYNLLTTTNITQLYICHCISHSYKKREHGVTHALQ